MAPSAGLTARIWAAAIVAARPPCWARRTITKPPTASAKTSTRTAPATCLAQFFIRPNNGGSLEKVCEAFAQQLDAARIGIGGEQLAHGRLRQRHQGFDALPAGLDGRADNHADGFS